MAINKMVLLVPIRHRRSRGYDEWRTTAYVAIGGIYVFRTAACAAPGGFSGFRCQSRGLRYHFDAQIPGNTCDWAQRMSQGTMNRSLAVDRF